MAGAPVQAWRSNTDRGMYWVYVLLNTHTSPFTVGRGTP